MSKRLICPKCESPKVVEKSLNLGVGAAVRQCQDCKKESTWLPPKKYGFHRDEINHQQNEWQSWECVYIPGAMFLSSRLFEKNNLGDQ